MTWARCHYTHLLPTLNKDTIARAAAKEIAGIELEADGCWSNGSHVYLNAAE